MKHWFLVLVNLATLAAAETAQSQDAPDPWMTRISARHVAGEGVGHASSYSSLDWFLPLSTESDSTMWFGDFRGLMFNDGEFGSNVGTGYRWFVDDQNRIYGINCYWDTRNDN
ncbi:MAG: inverse autotransporter beta domain-containing protein, partial [Planctomycetota bacterium]